MRDNTVFNPGDVVMIRQWEDMVEEYGVKSSTGSIRCDKTFTSNMRDFCGVELTIESISGSTVHFADCPSEMRRYYWSTDMICHIDDESNAQKIDVPIAQFLNLIS